MAMAMRRLGVGSAELAVSAQGFGCMGMTANCADTTHCTDSSVLSLLSPWLPAGPLANPRPLIDP